MIEEIWNIICETFTKVIKPIRIPLLFTILLISILGILFSALDISKMNALQKFILRLLGIKISKRSDK